MIVAKFFIAFIDSVSSGSPVALTSLEASPISQEIAAVKDGAYNKHTRPSSGSIRAVIAAAPMATHGTECFLSSTFAATETTLESSSCREGELCIEDSTSPTGGRCFGFEVEELIDDSVALLPSRDLQEECAKCEGIDACDDGVDLSKIGCGSCNGKMACALAEGVVGQNSCNGDNACEEVRDVGSNSCNGKSACIQATVAIGSCQCNGERACMFTSDVALSSDGICPSESPSSSSQPTASLSPSASHQPSSIPSVHPSSKPSASPSLSSHPTASNSPSASHQPSLIPSVRPSSEPSESTHPSNMPSSQPTISNMPSSPPTTCSTSARKVKIESTNGEQIQLFDVKVFSVSGIDETKGVAAAATQSSTYKNDERFIASNAIDSDFGSFFHTNDTNAWWEVDMGFYVEVRSLEIINRWCGDTISIPNHCLCRLSYATLSLLDANDGVLSTQTLGNTCSKPSLKVDFGYNCNSCLPNASKLKLQSTTGKPLGLVEVEVYSAGVNVAADKNATMSSTFRDLDRLAAGAAVDEDYTSFSVNEGTDKSPWWEVDLGHSFDISDLKIFNRLNENLSTGGLCNLSEVAVLLLNADGIRIDAVLTGDTCGLLLWEHEYESSPLYCLRNINSGS